MGTVTTLARPVVRAVHAPGHGALVVALRADGLYTREKGRRTWYGPLAYGWLHLQGARIQSEAARRDRAARRGKR